MDPSQFSEARVAEMVAGITKYYREERALYLRASEPLAANWKTAVQHYFPKSLLDTVRTVALEGARIPPPPFYAEAVALSGGGFPDFVHLASVTCVDIIVFNGAIAPRTLFSRAGARAAGSVPWTGTVCPVLCPRIFEDAFLDHDSFGSAGVQPGSAFHDDSPGTFLRARRGETLDGPEAL